MKVEILEQGTVSRLTNTAYCYQGWPTVCIDEQGTLYVASSGCRLGHLCTFGKNLFTKSVDGGKTWSTPRVINDTLMDDRDAGLVYMGNGKIIMTYFNNPPSLYFDNPDWIDRYAKTEELRRVALDHFDEWRRLDTSEYDVGAFLKISYDYGKTWSESYRTPISAPHGPIMRSDGSLLYVGRRFGNDDYGHTISAYESFDDGRTWSFLSDIEPPIGCENNINEAHALEFPDGSILGVVRGDGPPVPYNFSVFTCWSYDGGKTWTRLEPTDICGAPPHLLRLDDGTVVMAYGRRRPPYGEYVSLSEDGGKTFGEGILLREHVNWDMGYPSSVTMPDGSIMTVYYQSLEGDDYDSILFTRWRLV